MAIKRTMNKEDVARAVAEESGFYIKNCRVLLDALEQVILANMKMARIDNDSEMYLAKGVYLQGKRKPETESIDPRDRSVCVSPEKVIPSARFTQQFRNKLFAKPHGYERVRRAKMYRGNQKEKEQKGGESL